MRKNTQKRDWRIIRRRVTYAADQKEQYTNTCKASIQSKYKETTTVPSCWKGKETGDWYGSETPSINKMGYVVGKRSIKNKLRSSLFL